MQFDLGQSFEILSRTPAILESMLAGVSKDWYIHNEGEDTWSPYDVLGHLIHGEKTDWIPRTEIILSDRADKSFIPFDRFAQMELGQEKSLRILLKEFRELREANLIKLAALDLSETEMEKTGIHPELGEITLKQLLATWTVHDLGHITQIARVMAKQYKDEVGPWIAYLSILTRE